MSAKTLSTLGSITSLCASVHEEIKEQRMERIIFKTWEDATYTTFFGLLVCLKTLIEGINNSAKITFLYSPWLILTC